jgi:hypothetical protein
MNLYSITVQHKTLISKFVGNKKVSDVEEMVEVTTHDLPLCTALAAKKKFQELGQFVSMRESPQELTRKPYGPAQKTDVRYNSQTKSAPKKFDKKELPPVSKPKEEVLGGGTYADLVNTMLETKA